MNKLKILRMEKKLSQQDIGKIIGVSSQAIGLYEREKRDMSPEIIIKLSEFFNVSTDYLLGKSDKKTNDTDLSDIRIAQYDGIDTEGLSEEDIEEIKRQVEFMKWKKKNK